MEIDLEAIGKHLKSSSTKFDDLAVPDKPGVYAFLVSNDVNIGEQSHNRDHLSLHRPSGFAQKPHRK